jgi:MauM/NapG family ferredoxin protein
MRPGANRNPRKKSYRLNLLTSRREFFKLLLGGGSFLAALGLLSLDKGNKDEVVRPPGAVDEQYFNALCVRCSICLEVCPTKTITLSGFENGLTSVSTPKIDAEIGPCEFFRGRCEDLMQCNSNCPTGALKQVKKGQVRLGTVQFIQNNCLAYKGKECVVCSEMCPAPEAITITRDLKPVFHLERCVGCGTCVYSCPAQPKALKLISKGSRRA